MRDPDGNDLGWRDEPPEPDDWEPDPEPPPELVASAASDGGGTSMLDRLEAATLTTTQLQALPRPEFLVDGLLVRDSLALLYGAPGSYKSFLATDWTLSVAVGKWWQGREVRPGRVIYLAAEGVSGLGDRVTAWMREHQVFDLEQYEPVSWLTLPVNLTDTAQSAALLAYCAERAPDLVVIDTLARCAVGGDENSARDMGVLISHADAVRRATGATVLLVHHSGKDRTSGARGSNSLTGAVSTELEVSATDDLVVITTRKQKDAAAANPLRLRRKVVDLGPDDQGRPVSSCVLVPDRGPLDTDGEHLSKSQRVALEALVSIEVPTGITASVWKDQSELADRTFYNVRARLLDADLVRNIGSDHAPRYLTTSRIEQEDAA